MHPRDASRVEIFLDLNGPKLETSQGKTMVNKHNYEKSPCLMGKSTINDHFQ